MESTVQIALLVLIYTTGAVLILITVFLIRLLISTNKLAKTLNSTTQMINKELEPTLVEIKETLGSINKVAKNADNQMEKAKAAMDRLMCVPFKVGQKMRGLFAGLAQGLSAGIKLFRR